MNFSRSLSSNLLRNLKTKNLNKSLSPTSSSFSSLTSSSIKKSKNFVPILANTSFSSSSSSSSSLSFLSSSLSSKRSFSSEKLSFQAETKRLLDIVTHSIYTDKEVFLRELISNASDALEKLRFYHTNGQIKRENEEELKINIQIDPEQSLLTITDNGIGMTREELISNLGTIAKSGSKQFMENLKEKQTDGKSNIIGQFGVGFYSCFMVSDFVTVESISATSEGELKAYRWTSDGSGEFEITEIPPFSSSPGTRIIMKIKEDSKEFLSEDKIKSIIQHYSSFVSFPITLKDKVLNNINAIWTKNKKDVKDEEYLEFYKFFTNNFFNSPLFTLHFHTDIPIDLKVLLYVPMINEDKFFQNQSGASAESPSINLYNKKILIEAKPKNLLPEWLTFVKGVVDSEDLPLSLSREKPQDSALLLRIRDVLVRKILKFLETEKKHNPEKYLEFYEQYSLQLKQGICQDYKYMDSLSKLLLFDSSFSREEEKKSTEEGAEGEKRGEKHLISLDDYIARCPPDQKEIYYLVSSNRKNALSSPYYEIFKKNKKEVLFLYHTVDDFVMTNLKTYNGRPIVSAESSSINFDELEDEEKKEEKKEDEVSSLKPLTLEESHILCKKIKDILGKDKVQEVRHSTRLVSSPAIVVDHESGALRRMMRMVQQVNAGEEEENFNLPPQVLEINIKHPLIIKLYQNLKEDKSKEITGEIVDQIFDNALINASLLDDPKVMLNRMNKILLKSLE